MQLEYRSSYEMLKIEFKKYNTINKTQHLVI